MCSTLARCGLIDDLVDIVWRYVTIVWVMRCEVSGCTKFAAHYTEDEDYLCKTHAGISCDPTSFVRITNLAHGGDMIWPGFNQAEWVLRFWLKESKNEHVAFAHKRLVRWGGVEDRVLVVKKSRKPRQVNSGERKPWR